MQIYIENGYSLEFIIISADESLDLSAYGTFKEATSIAQHNPLFMAIVVDFNQTEKLFDSGMAMLLTLRQLSGRLKNRIYLTHVNPSLFKQLKQYGLSNKFLINQQPGELLKTAILINLQQTA